MDAQAATSRRKPMSAQGARPAGVRLEAEAPARSVDSHKAEAPAAVAIKASERPRSEKEAGV
jgi:hypothetical protein